MTTKGTLEKHIHVIEADNLEHLKALNESQKKLEQLDEEKRSVLMELDKHLNEKKHIIKNMWKWRKKLSKRGKDILRSKS